MKYYIETWGCQMNEYDSELIAGILESLGYFPARDEKEADLIILNTCCVRQTAENKVYGKLGRLRKLKELKRDLIIGVCGCMPQQKDVAEHIRKRFSHVNLIFGTHNVHRLPELLREVKEERRRTLDVWPQAGKIIEGLPVRRKSGLRAWVPVIHGCNNFCTYCIVPYVRGRERSRLPEDIIAEVEGLAKDGFKEIFLLGQNVNSYGKDLVANIDFADLLYKLNKIKGIKRIRFITSHPRDFNSKLIKAVAECNKVCEHIHLPVQAGSNKVLRKMNRGYSREDYLSLVNKIKEEIPGVGLTTDIMVGFPGETEDDFKDTIDLVEKVRFDGAFTFIYNTRRGTPAARMPEQVPEEEKRKRITKLIEIQNKISLEKNREEEGRMLEVLVEGESKNDPRFISGRTRSNKLVIFPGNIEMEGKLVQVRIIRGELTHLVGEIHVEHEGDKMI